MSNFKANIFYEDVICTNDVYNGDLLSFKKGKIYHCVHIGKPTIILNEFNEEHEVGDTFKEEHFLPYLPTQP